MNPSIDCIIDFATSQALPMEETIDHPDLFSPPYQAKTWTHYSDPSGVFAAGVWEAESCIEKFVAEHEEFCHIIQGSVRLTDEQGYAKTFGPGSQFTIAAGFRGLWENLGLVRKAYVIWTPPKPAEQPASLLQP
ncbi:cupin domain-containing protein [Pseudomonas sp.]|uniref:cupin domain-containing protein n=1 Tax=Pseudomonas sp. TaxID=306 RepID=UPI003C7625BF